MSKVVIKLYQNNNEKSDLYKQFFGRVDHATPIDKNTLCEYAAADSNIEVSDIAAIYDAQFKQISELVCNGHAICVEGLGTFKISVSSTGISPEEVQRRHPEYDPTKDDIRDFLSSHQVKKSRLLFLPSKEIKEALRSVKFVTNKKEWIDDNND